MMMNLRGAVTEKWNKEVVWSKLSVMGRFGVLMTTIRYKAMPRDLVPGRNAKNATNRSQSGCVSLGLTNSFLY